ncbi:MAG: M48 family metalloprotease [Bacteroidales bacterium]
MRRLFLPLVMSLALFLSSCDEDGNLNFFSLQQDKEFGQEFNREILANDAEYPLLNERQYADAYEHLRRIRDEIVASDDLRYAREFDWEVRIIHNDDVLNAFCVPGGYMYFYTGLIKYLDDEAQFAGVMAHEMAHADRRHTTARLTRAYGFQFLLAALLGDDPSAMAQIAAELTQGLSSLAFSRDDEYEADSYAVRYTADTDYDPRGVAGFFEKLEGGTRAPEFLSTHPNPGNRVGNIYDVWAGLGSPEGELFESRYQEFINSLP